MQAHSVTIDQEGGAGRTRPRDLEIACAKMLADRAARLVTAVTHQPHGAIGMTKEYPLHHVTRRLWAWHDKGKGHHRCPNRLGAALVARRPDARYPAIQCGSEVLA
ncbi:hypothetical protein [Mycobacterium persicum]|uniref:Acyl-CoA dehydrogenase/oxidase C-terminal domain-containing protein n=2 Tax=Mycobacteriaceae TaxID=1762 RepID=A0A1X0LDP2_9MYCO|nr:hypothetical protein [Mycobacterium persicum]KZS81728.1 hypothetical protein A4G31_20300 [Mycobacterium persicum]ORB91411.1 hypothetical protein B1T49_21710 [Mycobacterium persicum]ORB96706.1 hypothetical protein B1T44_21870 [Mycobacterium persicum]ORC03415.1 hypothetical protein B1T48_21430 [Mycobacterium persicum]ORC08871.1 hypothetical protein B4U45_22005 [Mycobacterium persicum]